MSKIAELLILNEIKIEEKCIDQAVAMWKAAQQKNPQNKCCLYISENDVLEMTVAEQHFKAGQYFSGSILFSLEKKLEHFLLSDWKKQVLILKDVVKPQEDELPSSPFLQLRHIEVPLKVYDEYDVWRKRTIFEYVKRNANVDSFSAYHSLFSTEPGVTFLSGFSCDTNTYLNSFSTPEYQKIVQEAGKKYICGGDKSLYTKIYQKA